MFGWNEGTGFIYIRIKRINRIYLYPDETNKPDLFKSGLNRSNRIDPVLNPNREKPDLNPNIEGRI